MNRIKTIFARFRRDESGASAVEFSIVAVLFVVSSMGVMELGRTYQVRNEMAYAADIGARELTIMVNDPSIAETDYETNIKSLIENQFLGYTGSTLQVTVSGPTVINGVTYRELNLKYPMSVFIPFRGNTWDLEITRRAVQL